MPMMRTKGKIRFRQQASRFPSGRPDVVWGGKMNRKWLAIAGLVGFAAAMPWPLSTLAADSGVPAAEAAKTPIGAGELQLFARAASQIFNIRQAYAPKVQSARSEIDARDFIIAAEREMGEAIRREGLTVDRYNEILRAAQRDSSLAARIQALVDKAASGK